MALPPGWGDPSVVPQLVAQHMLTTANAYAQQQGLPPIAIEQEYLTSAVGEITPETQVAGAALLQITINDPDWQIQRSGICDQTPDGLLYQVDINLPEGTDVWWRLAMVDGSSADASADSPNLTLTFQHRIISYLMDCWGPLGWPSGKVGSTRAQFIRMLVSKMPSELPKESVGPGPAPDATFICPEINEIQPVAGNNTYGTEVITSNQASAKAAGINKLPAVTAASKILIKGNKPNAQQLADINTAMGVAESLKANVVAMEAMIFAGIAESSFDRNEVTPSSNGEQMGIWQSDSIPGNEVSQQATAFLQGGPSFGGGGAIKQSKTISDPIQIAENVEVGGSYAGEDGYSSFLPEAKTIVSAFAGTGLLTGTSGISPDPESDVAQLTRGSSENPDEDSWTCMQRLASEVNWLIFSDPSPSPGVFGNYLYYIDGPTCAAQKPSLYIALSDDGTTWSATDPDTGKTVAADGVLTNLTYTFDNTAFIYEQTRKVKGKTQRKTNIRTPQTPSQVTFNMICGALEFNAGQVFVFHEAGPLKGRWIVEDVTHNMLQDLFAQFTLGPPTFPYPEPQANSVTVLGPNGQPVSISTSTGKDSNGSSVGSAISDAGSVGGYVNPMGKVMSLTPHRVDQGVDFGGQGPLLAVGDGKILDATTTNSGWPGGGWVLLQLSGGLFAGKCVYYAEDLTPTVNTGDQVKAGQPVATLHDPGISGLEIGWALPSGQTLAASLGENALQTGQGSDSGDCQSQAGRNFNQLLIALGQSPAGGPGSGPLSTGPGLPSSWPTIGKLTTVGASVSSTASQTPAQINAPSTSAPDSQQIAPNQSVQLSGVYGSLFG